MHARRYFVKSEPSDPQAVEALAFIRTLYYVERQIQDERDKPGSTFTNAEAVRVRRRRARPSVTPGISGRVLSVTSTTPGSPLTTGSPSRPGLPSTRRGMIQLAARRRR